MKKKLLYSITLIFIGLFGFYFWASSPNLEKEDYSKIIIKSEVEASSNDSIYTIVTYNLGYLSGMTNNLPVERTSELFSKNINRLEEQIELVEPDVIAFQEIDFKASRSYNVDQLDAVMNLGYPFAAKAINWDETYVPFPYGLPSKHFGAVVSGQAVVSKFRVKYHERVVLERPESLEWYKKAFYLDRLAQVAKVNIRDKEVIIINVHLEAYDKETRKAQAEYVLEVYKKYENDYPTILLGDFNSEPKDKDAVIHQFLTNKSMGTAAFSANAAEGTYSSVNPEQRIDFIFYNTKFIDYVDGSVLSEFGDISDHLPVLMRFKLK